MLIITLSNNKLPNIDEKISWYCHWLNIEMKLSCMLIIRPNMHSCKFHGGIQDTKFERKCGWVWIVKLIHDTPRFLFRIRMCLRQKAKRESRKMIKSGMEFELATVAVLYILLYLINTSVLVLIYFKRSYFLIDIQLVILLNSSIYIH